MIEIGEMTGTDERTERGERTETNGTTWPREMKESVEMSGRRRKRRRGERGLGLSALETTHGLQSGLSLRWTCGLLYRKAPQRTTRRLDLPQRLTDGLPCPDTSHLQSSENVLSLLVSASPLTLTQHKTHSRNLPHPNKLCSPPNSSLVLPLSQAGVQPLLHPPPPPLPPPLPLPPPPLLLCL